MGFISWSFVPVVIVVLVFSAFRILREYERGVVFMLGRFWKVKGPGLIVIIPGVQATVKVNAVVFFRVIDPQRAIIQVEDYYAATNQLAQTTLRSVLGKHELDEMLAERDKLNADIQKILDVATDAWGIKVTTVEIKHVDIDPSMVRAIARQAEA